MCPLSQILKSKHVWSWPSNRMPLKKVQRKGEDQLHHSPARGDATGQALLWLFFFFSPRIPFCCLLQNIKGWLARPQGR